MKWTRVSESRRAVFSILALGLLLGTAMPAAADVIWSHGERSTPRQMKVDELRESLVQLGNRADRRHVMIHFGAPVDADRRAELEASGVRLLSYLGGNAYFATLREGFDAARAAAAPGLVQVGEIRVVDKLHPDLAAGVIRPWSVVEGKGWSGELAPPPSPEGVESQAVDPIVVVYVLFHGDFDLEPDAAKLVRGYAGKIHSYIRSLNGAVVHLPASRVRTLAEEDGVMYVEPPLPKMVGFNDSNRALLGTETVNAPPYGLDGSGVTVLVYDAGQMFAHGDFGDRLTIGASDTEGISDHATHVGGTIGGDGSGSDGQYRGMAPAVEFVSYGFEQEGGLTQGFLYTDPGDLEADYSEAIHTYGADISNNSIGSNTAPNGFPCEWEGNYGTTGALIDAIARGSLGDPFRIVWANGNERSSGACGSTYLTTAPPACAKNHITVGALNSDTDGVTSFTSWGPTDDGRLKPDISGPGCQSGGDGGVTSTNSSGGYNVKCGTSMASPSVCGVSALVLQQYRQSYPGERDFRNSTLKAILANTAQDIVDPGPDYQSGYGSVRAQAAVDAVRDGLFVEAEVGQGGTYAFIVIVGPGDDELKVTLAWDDPPGTPNVNPVLVNDLDLRVFDGGGTQYHPWTLDPDNPAEPAVRNTRDDANNIEQVLIDNPAPGAYRVEVVGFSIAQGPTQTFSAAAGPTLINCSSSGLLGTTANRITCGGDLGFQVIDCDLNTDDALVETVSISVTSDSEPAGETLLLVENAPESAAFEGTLPISTADASGVLQISEGDTITATYIDADDGEGGTNVPVTRQVVVDCTAPEVTSVTMTQINPRDALSAIQLSEPGRVTLSYGESCGAPTSSVVSYALVEHHDVRMTGLADDTTYYFSVEAEDEAGNVADDTNGGLCYSFTTPEIPDFLTEQFSAGLDLEGRQTTFTPNGTPDFYAYCTEPLVGGLPTDPAGGTNLNLSDDQPASFDLTDGVTVSLYGQSYGTVYVGPNGYLTFTGGDSDYTETFADHFDLPRVSAVFDDLNPASAGSVTYRQLADRIAVTWDAVPEYSSSNSNTFQIEMFFDGRIRFSWVQLDTTDAIVGLSAGLGLDPDFFESDISEGGSCHPVPPTVESFSLATGANTSVPVELSGSDDGQPAPLTYRLTSLPAGGTLKDNATGRAVRSVPHDLANGGRSLTYTPNMGYEGPDQFDYVADDGGAPPDGGVSDPATVSLSIGGPQVLFEYLTDDTNPGWTTTGDWEYGSPTGGGSHGGDPSSGATGSSIYGYNLSGDYDNDMAAETLTSHPIDLSNVGGTTLEFQRWLGIADSSGDRAFVVMSVDGGPFRKIWSHFGPPISDGEWTLQSFDVSQFADGAASVEFRWVMGETDDTETYPGWNIDDVRVLGTVDCSIAPGEVSGLFFDRDKALRWDPVADGSGQAPYYDVLRSDEPSDFGAAVCVESNDGADAYADDAGVPDPPRGLFFYLVRAENGCGAGPLSGAHSAPDCN